MGPYSRQDATEENPQTDEQPRHRSRLRIESTPAVPPVPVPGYGGVPPSLFRFLPMHILFCTAASVSVYMHGSSQCNKTRYTHRSSLYTGAEKRAMQIGEQRGWSSSSPFVVRPGVEIISP